MLYLMIFFVLAMLILIFIFFLRLYDSILNKINDVINDYYCSAAALGVDEELCLASLQRHDGDIDRSANALLGHANRFARGFAEDLERYPAAAAAAVVDDARGLEVDNNTLAAHTTALDRRRLVAGDAAESAPRRHLLSPPAVSAEREETFLVGDRVDGQLRRRRAVATS
jgi:hypothetical protein